MAEGLHDGPRSGRAIIRRDEFHDQAAATRLAAREPGSRVDGHATAGVLDGEGVALQQFGQRVGCGPGFLFDLDAEGLAAGRAGRRAAPHLAQPDHVRQARAQRFRHGSGGQVLVERQGDPLAPGGETERQGFGEGHLQTRVESLG